MGTGVDCAGPRSDWALQAVVTAMAVRATDPSTSPIRCTAGDRMVGPSQCRCVRRTDTSRITGRITGRIIAGVTGSVWILGGYQSDFARNLTREGRDFAALTREVVDHTWPSR